MNNSTEVLANRDVAHKIAAFLLIRHH